MEVIALTDDRIDDYDLQDFKSRTPVHLNLTKFIYSYTNYGYDGNGAAIYLDSEGQWHFDEFHHCSCYGPLSEGYNKTQYTLAEIILLLAKRKDEYDGEHAKRIFEYIGTVKL